MDNLPQTGRRARNHEPRAQCQARRRRQREARQERGWRGRRWQQEQTGLSSLRFSWLTFILLVGFGAVSRSYDEGVEEENEMERREAATSYIAF